MKPLEYLNCPKCGTMVDVKKMRRKEDHACPSCKEPIQVLIEMDRWDWRESDFKGKGV